MRNLLQISIVFIFTLSIFSNPANSGEDEGWRRHAPPLPTLSEDDDAGDKANAAASLRSSSPLFNAEELKLLNSYGRQLSLLDFSDPCLIVMGKQWDEAKSLYTDTMSRVLKDGLKSELDSALNRYRDQLFTKIRTWKNDSNAHEPDQRSASHASDQRRKIFNAFKRKISSILERQSQHSGAPQAALSINPLLALAEGNYVVRAETQHNGSTVVTIEFTVELGQYNEYCNSLFLGTTQGQPDPSSSSASAAAASGHNPTTSGGCPSLLEFQTRFDNLRASITAGHYSKKATCASQTSKK